ncbi:MAG: DUF1538 domain-containing protein [Bacilli bacterium]|nr:DUF1538 domain-containing protein [Bacilli bacterium]
MSVLLTKFKEVALSVIPIMVIVTILNFTLVPLGSAVYVRFLIGSVLIMLGLTIFLIGIDIGVTPVGQLFGSKLAKTNKIWIVALFGLFLGFVISIAEPDLEILARQIETITQGGIAAGTLVIFVSIGVALLIMLGLIRILFDVPLFKIMLVMYILIILSMIFVPQSMIAIAFDSSGATTGALTVPFVLALAVGVSNLKKNGKKSEKDSFGLVGLASGGAIIGVIILSFISKTDTLSGSLDGIVTSGSSLLLPFLTAIPDEAKNTLISITPILVIFVVANFFALKVYKRQFVRIIQGFLYVFIGLILFLVGAHQGFMEVGAMVGQELAMMDSKIWLFIVSFVIGLTIVLAEPAVYVLTRQIETITSGYVNRKFVTLFLSLAMGMALILNMVRILVPSIELWHILVPGYVIALVLMFFSPKLFVGIGFDAGGVASGPMSATFVLTFAQGVAFSSPATSVIENAFGMIALIAMMPIISIEILGLLFKWKSKKEGISHEL